VSVPLFSIVVCTQGRPELDACLSSLRSQDYPRIEVVVVENGMRGAAEGIARRWGARFLFDPYPGVSAARNSGVRSSLGELIAFIDDDAVADAGWVSALAGEFEDPSISGIAGRIVPLTAGSERDPGSPELPNYWEPTFGRCIIDQSSPDWFEILNFGCLANASNLAIRRCALEGRQAFDARFGRGRPLRSFADHHAFFSLVAAGHRVLYAPSAVVRHPAPENIAVARRTQLDESSAAAAYMLLLWFEWPHHRGRLLKFAAGWFCGARRNFRGDSRAPRLVSRWQQLLQAAWGPVLYLRTRSQAPMKRSSNSDKPAMASTSC
jgi:glycosyltransferase involved in cell wall biosynthesis